MIAYKVRLKLHLKIPYYSVVKDRICSRDHDRTSETFCCSTRLLPTWRALASTLPQGSWWSGPGLNRQPPACKADALPIELPPRFRSLDLDVLAPFQLRAALGWWA